ncbi:Eco57I restriction-modification methylase domain-containing protein [Psychroserpens damuponensis]|uniref:Eco57I restriction-modification methylase domain-containing protein n=1 Tax=Psychroserpens damuponensis TaxID=943936 RepID=UPI0005915907|nr:TaqI-like C-terminal specificity domain-containing protein [Psychroserpens damuponensis]
MALFQTSVIKTYLAQQDNSVVERAYKKYTKYFHNATIQENIKNSKEEQYQAKFLDELFVNVLGYTLNPKPDFNITTEFKNQKGAGKADGAILKETKAIGVIELKGTNTKDLESIRKQAFDYKANQKGCVYVITSNFEKLRFYINDATEFLEFNLFQLAPEEFALMYLCLQKDNILNNLPLTIKEASLVEEDKITKQFYNDYSVFKRELFRDLVKRNAKRIKSEAVTSSAVEMSQETDELKALEKNVKLSLFKKSQKLIDRFLFIFFAEDRDLLPPNSTIQILDKWKADIDFGDERPLYNLFKQYFHFLDEGRKGTTSRAEIYAYNGGLFKPDAILDSLEIDDDLLYKHTYKLAKYDFSSQVDVNILGHIFENSLNEIESINAEIEGGEFDKQKSKRKKDGVFYTPKYITKYIVENTVGKLCQEKKDQLGFKEEAYFEIKKGTHQNTKKQLLEVLDNYREWLLQITICDPACGSGAFLNQALDFLIKEHRYIDELKAKVLGGGLILSDIENTILENNIYGVDLNEESVEIAKLSLWLRTAQPRRKLSDLSSNIKCGNSLIDSKTVAGDKAFNWQQEFPQIFNPSLRGTKQSVDVKQGFDVVIGNPPYVSSKDGNFTNNEKEYYLGKYDTSVYQIDLYVLFIEKCSHLINRKGIISLIIPNAWLNNIFLSPVRKKILAEYKLYEFVDMPSNTFIDANVDTIIVNYGLKKRGKETVILYFDNSQIFEKFSSLQEGWLQEDNFIINLSVNKSILNCLRKIEKNTLKLSEISRIGRGVGLYHKRVGHTKEFISQDPFQSNIQKDSTFKPYIKGKNINRWTINWQNDGYVSYGKWLAEPREIDFFEGNRILLRQIPSKLLYATEIEELFFTDQSVFIAKFNENSEFNSKSVLGIINSKLMSFYFRFKHSEFDDLFPKVKLQHFKDFPIAKSNTVLLENVLKIQTFANQHINQKNSFQRFILSSFNLLKLSRKLENWHELDFADFIKELNKAIKKAGGTPLAKKDEFEWLELFEDNKKKAQELQAQITQTEKTIDTMVYDLYGLTEEERDIVENA